MITYDDGRLELEVLHTGPPHGTEDIIDCRRFTCKTQQETSRALTIATPADLQKVSTLIRAILLDTTAS